MAKKKKRAKAKGSKGKSNPRKALKKAKKAVKKIAKKKPLKIKKIAKKTQPKKGAKKASASRLKVIKKAYKKNRVTKPKAHVVKAKAVKKELLVKKEPVAVVPAPETEDFRVYDEEQPVPPVEDVVSDDKDEEYKENDDFDFGFDKPDQEESE